MSDVIPSGVSESQLLRLALSLEKKSEHPLARAVVAYAEDGGLTPLEITDFKSLTGRGVYGIIDGKEARALSFTAAYELIGDAVPTKLGRRG